MLNEIRTRFCSHAARRADQALAFAKSQRQPRENAVQTSRSSNEMMNAALKELHAALQRTPH